MFLVITKLNALFFFEKKKKTYFVAQGAADKGPFYGPGPASWEKPRMPRRWDGSVQIQEVQSCYSGCLFLPISQ